MAPVLVACQGLEMGYDIHVHRADDWLDANETPISAAEWSTYVDGCGDLCLDGFAESPLANGDVVRVDDPTMVVWTACPNRGTLPGPWFWLSDGSTEAKDPTPDVVKRLHEISVALEARVQGDDGESYGPDGAPMDVVAEPEPAIAAAPNKRWFRRS